MLPSPGLGVRERGAVSVPFAWGGLTAAAVAAAFAFLVSWHAIRRCFSRVYAMWLLDLPPPTHGAYLKLHWAAAAPDTATLLYGVCAGVWRPRPMPASTFYEGA